MSATAFQATRWTLVARAAEPNSPAAHAALDELCRLYWPPLCSFARRWGLSAADAEDATQNFFAELLRGEKFAVADAERGRLRTFLLTTFTKRLIDFHRPARAQSRGAGQLPLSLDAPLPGTDLPIDPADPQTPAEAFNHDWAMTTMETAIRQLEAESSHAALFAACRPLLSLDAAGNEDYAAIARELGMKEGAVRVAAHRLRQRFREVLFAVVAETLDTPSEANVRAEIGALIEALR